MIQQPEEVQRPGQQRTEQRSPQQWRPKFEFFVEPAVEVVDVLFAQHLVDARVAKGIEKGADVKLVGDQGERTGQGGPCRKPQLFSTERMTPQCPNGAADQEG